MKRRGPFLNMDERNKQIAYKVITVMYFLTIISLQGISIYRQFVLGQSISDFEDIAIIMTINSLFLISALLYFGALPIQKLNLKKILLGYLVIVIVGILFTYAKYNIFQSPGLSFEQLVGKLMIIFIITGIIVAFFVLFSLLGIKKINKELN